MITKFEQFINENTGGADLQVLSDILKANHYATSVQGDKLVVDLDWSIDVDELDSDLDRPIYVDVTVTLSQAGTYTATISAYHKEVGGWSYSNTTEGETDLNPDFIADEVSDIISECSTESEIIESLRSYYIREEDDEDY